MSISPLNTSKSATRFWRASIGFRSGQFVGGAFVERFESAAARYIGVPQVVGVNSGTDALELGLWALGIGPGDEVITPPNSYIASTAAISRVGATPVFADVGRIRTSIPAASRPPSRPAPRRSWWFISPAAWRTWRPSWRSPIATASLVIEDAAQAMGSTFDGQRAGSFGAIGCFSAHPGQEPQRRRRCRFIATRDVALARRLRNLRRHGWKPVIGRANGAPSRGSTTCKPRSSNYVSKNSMA